MNSLMKALTKTNLNNYCIIKFQLVSNFNRNSIKLNHKFYSTLNNTQKKNLFKSQIFKSSSSTTIKSNVKQFIRQLRILRDSNPKSKTEKVNINGIKRLLSLASPEKYKLMGAMFLLLISSSVTMVVPFYLGKLIDFITTGDKETMKSRLKNISLIMTGIFLIGAIANFGRVYIIQSTGQKIIMRLREKLFRSIMAQEMAFFDKVKTGELVNRLSADTEVVGLSVSQNLSDGLRSTVQFTTAVGLMFYISPSLSLFGLSSIPAVTIFALIFGRYIKSISKKVSDVLAEATEVAEEKLSSIRTVRSFAQEEKEMQSYSKSLTKVMNMKFKEALANGLFFGITGFSGNIIVLSVFYFGGELIASQAISIGDLSAFLMYSVWVGLSIGGLTSFYTELMRGIGASTRTWEIIDKNPLIPLSLPSGLDVPAEIFSGDIKFENVTFSYPTRSEQKIFDNFNLVIPGGKILAVVGASGSGKSTLGALILRFYDPDQGSIKIGDVDVRKISPKMLRNHIGTVPQEPVLFSTSIKENIAYGVTDPSTVSLEQIYEAADQANAFSFIESFPDKFNTLVGERGANLSGGQKQRIAIARAILLGPRILLLDEATSALDAASEFLVQEALDRIMENRTVIIIAHRLSTIKNADLIAVLDKGQVVELGTYNELVQKDTGQFRELVARQTVDVEYSVNLE